MEGVAKPLIFAARDDFAHLDRLRDVEQTVARAAANALRLSIPRDARDALKRVEQTLAAALEGPARVAALRRAQQLAAPFADPDWSETALARPTTALPGVGPKRAEILPSAIGREAAATVRCTRAVRASSGLALAPVTPWCAAR